VRRSSRAAAVTAAGVVVLVELSLVVGLVVFVVLDDGWSQVLWIAVGALLLWNLVPRPERVRTAATPLTRAGAPSVWALAEAVADAVGTRPPGAAYADTRYPVVVQPTGYLGGAALVVGLPQWTALDPDERVAVLADELAAAAVWRSPGGRLVRLADDLLSRWVLLLGGTPTVQPYAGTLEHSDTTTGVWGPGDDLAGDRARREAAGAVGRAGLAVVATPVKAVQHVLHRAWAPTVAAAVLAADARAARVAGADAVRRLLLSGLGVPRGLVAAQVAGRRGEDPFEAIAAAARPDPQELARRLEVATATGERTDPWHPPTARRVAALDTTGGATAWPGTAGVAAADVELRALRPALRSRLRDELVHGSD
jgi:heat shock protein HtpX